MEIGKVSVLMEQFRQTREKGGRLTLENQNLRAKIRETRELDQVNGSILRAPTSDAEDGSVWEQYAGLNDYNIDHSGALSILIGGVDADGEHCTAKMVCYPPGRWFKFETELSRVPNPFWVDPDKPDPEPEPPIGYGRPPGRQIR